MAQRLNSTKLERTLCFALAGGAFDISLDSPPCCVRVGLFSVSLDDGEVEWGSKGLSSLFARRKNALSPGFYGMLKEMTRFNREAPRLLELDDDDPRKVSRVGAVSVHSSSAWCIRVHSPAEGTAVLAKRRSKPRPRVEESPSCLLLVSLLPFCPSLVPRPGALR